MAACLIIPKHLCLYLCSPLSLHFGHRLRIYLTVTGAMFFAISAYAVPRVVHCDQQGFATMNLVSISTLRDESRVSLFLYLSHTHKNVKTNGLMTWYRPTVAVGLHRFSNQRRVQENAKSVNLSLQHFRGSKAFIKAPLWPVYSL